MRWSINGWQLRHRAGLVVVLDIDDTCDVVHGHQQLSLFNAHYDERCFLPIHVYDSERQAVLSRSCCGRARRRPASRCAPICAASCGAFERAGRRPASRSGATAIMPVPRRWTLCEQNGVSYIFGLPGARPLASKVQEVADAVRTQRALESRGRARLCRDDAPGQKLVVRAARGRPHRGTRLGLDIRFVVTNLTGTSPRVIYESLYCARGQAENWIKFHKAQLASDRTSCRRAMANQVRLVLHTAAYWLMLAVREAIPAARSRPGGVRDAASAPAQDRRAGAGNRQPRPPRLRLLLPGSGSRPPPCGRSCTPATGSLALSDGAAIAPINPSCPANAFPTFQTSPR